MDRKNFFDFLWILALAVLAPIWIPIVLLVVLVYGGCFCSRHTEEESDIEENKLFYKGVIRCKI